MECGYCGGTVEWSDERWGYVHTSGPTLPQPVASPGDFVTGTHVRGGRVNAADVVE